MRIVQFRAQVIAACLGISGALAAGVSAAEVAGQDEMDLTAPVQTLTEAPVTMAEPEMPAAVTTPPPAASSATAKPATPADSVRMQLDGTRWALTLQPIGGDGKSKPQNDSLRFEGRTVASAGLEKSGYNASNYTLTVAEDGLATWETMQTKAEQGVVFWKGELQDGKMQGVMSRHPIGKPAEDFTFTGHEESGKQVVAPKAGEAIVLPTAPAHASAPAAGAAAPRQAPSPAQAAPAKKKRGWFGR